MASQEPLAPGLVARYQRQISVIGAAAQKRLLSASAMVIGLGGLGNPAAANLALCGIGRLVLNDFDVIELSNLGRQFLFCEDDIMQPKVEVAARRLRPLRPGIDITELDGTLDERELAACLAEVDVALDCTDNFESRFALNRACVASATPLVSASALAMGGQLAVFDRRQTGAPCYQCLFPSLDDEESDCNRAGIIAPVASVIASLQAMEAIKLLTADAPMTEAHFYNYSAKDHSLRHSVIPPDPSCPVCRNTG